MSDMQNSDNQLEGFEEGPAIPPERPTGGGRPFITALTVIGVILLVGLIALGIVLLTRNPASTTTDEAARFAQNTQIAAAATLQVQTQQAQATQNALQSTVSAQNTQVAAAATGQVQTQQAQATQKALQGVPTATQGATATSVVAVPTATSTPIPPTAVVLPADQTKTAIAKGTQPAGGVGTGTPQATATGLPKTGFADDQNSLPLLLGIAALLVIIILGARRLRSSAR